MVHNDYLGKRSLISHLANVTSREKRTFSPGALIAIRVNSGAYVIGESESQRFKIACDIQFKFFDDVHETGEVRIFEKGLCLDTFFLQAIKTDVVAHTFDERRFKILNMLLYKRNIFIKELLL